MITLGNESGTALRITMGKLTRRGVYRSWMPCVFLIWKGRRRVG